MRNYNALFVSTFHLSSSGSDGVDNWRRLPECNLFCAKWKNIDKHLTLMVSKVLSKWISKSSCKKIVMRLQFYADWNGQNNEIIISRIFFVTFIFFSYLDLLVSFLLRARLIRTAMTTATEAATAAARLTKKLRNDIFIRFYFARASKMCNFIVRRSYVYLLFIFVGSAPHIFDRIQM